MTETFTPGSVLHVDPSTLLVDANVRAGVDADKDFVASLKEFGVLQPITALSTDSGELRVRYGHRRTLGAIAAGLSTVPVLVAGDEATGKAADVERILTQYAENQHREGLSDSETVSVVEQLRLLDVSATQIAKKTRLPRAAVAQAVTIAGSKLATAAHTRYDLTLDQAAAVAEFEDDTEAVKRLVAAAANGRFEHAVSGLRQEREDARVRAEFHAELEQLGVRIIDEPNWSEPPRGIDRLTTAEGEPITLEQHAECPGHVVWATERWGYVKADGTVIDEDDLEETETDEADVDGDEPEEAEDQQWNRYLTKEYGCEDPAGHGHLVDGRSPRVQGAASADLSDEDRASAADAAAEAKRRQRREVIANNKAWDAATEVRREWIKGHLGARRKTPPAGSAAFVNHLLAHDHYILQYADSKVREYGWLPQDEAEWHKDASEARSQVVTLLLALAAHENHSGRDSWRNPQRWTKRYLLWLQDAGYALADVERKAAGLPALDDTSGTK